MWMKLCVSLFDTDVTEKSTVRQQIMDRLENVFLHNRCLIAPCSLSLRHIFLLVESGGKKKKKNLFVAVRHRLSPAEARWPTEVSLHGVCGPPTKCLMRLKDRKTAQ